MGMSNWSETSLYRRLASAAPSPGIFRTPQLHREALMWGCALVWLGLFANLEQPGWSLCPLHALGLDFCPGCGLGRSIGLALRGQFAASWARHPLGLFALAVLVSRIFSLTFPGMRSWIQPLRNLRLSPFSLRLRRPVAR